MRDLVSHTGFPTSTRTPVNTHTLVLHSPALQAPPDTQVIFVNEMHSAPCQSPSITQHTLVKPTLLTSYNTTRGPCSMAQQPCSPPHLAQLPHRTVVPTLCHLLSPVCVSLHSKMLSSSTSSRLRILPLCSRPSLMKQIQ